MKILIPILFVAGAGALVAFLPFENVRAVKAITKTPPTPAMKARWAIRRADTNRVFRVWKDQHNPKRAAEMMQAMIARREFFPAWTLAEAYTDAGEYAQALEAYRSIFVYPHEWSSTEEHNLGTIDAYRQMARKLGAGKDVAHANDLLLKYYTPLGNEPPLFPPDSKPKTIEAFVDMILAYNRGAHNNGVAYAERAVAARPNDPVFQWIAGDIDFDARHLPQAKAHFLIAHKLGGLDKGSRNRMDLDMIDLQTTKADPSLLRRSPVKVVDPPTGPRVVQAGSKPLYYDLYTGQRVQKPWSLAR